MVHKMKYKGHEGSVLHCAEDNLLHGRLLRIRDMVTYDGLSIPEIEKNFQGAVDEYLAFCAAIGKKPNRPLKEVIKLRTSRDLHRRLALYAHKHDLSTDAVISDAVQHYRAHAR